MNLYQNYGKIKLQRKKGTSCDPERMALCVRHGDRSVVPWGCMAAKGMCHYCLLLMQLLRSSGMNSVVYRTTLSAQIHPDAYKLN